MTESIVEAFKNFDFDNNEKWKEYLSKVEITSENHQSQIEKLKAKWYKREINTSFDISLLSNCNQNEKQQRTTETETDQNNTNESTTTNTTTDNNQNNTNSQRKSTADTSILLLHIGVLLFGFISLIPISPRSIHRYFFQFALLAHLFKVVRNNGVPTSYTSFTAIKEWAMRIMPTTDFQYACLTLLFWSKVPTIMAFIPSTILAFYHVSFSAYTKFHNHSLWKKYINSYFNYFKSKTREALLLNAGAEIGTGLMLLFKLITPQRSIITCVVYWQWLRVRYFSIDASQYHRHIWYGIGLKCEPIFKFVPLLRYPVKYAQQWFCNLPQTRSQPYQR